MDGKKHTFVISEMSAVYRIAETDKRIFATVNLTIYASNISNTIRLFRYSHSNEILPNNNICYQLPAVINQFLSHSISAKIVS